MNKSDFVAKALVHCGLSRAVLYGTLRRKAAAMAAPGESLAQATVRFSQTTEQGQALMKAYRAAGGDDWRPPAREPIAKAEPPEPGAAAKQIAALAEKLRMDNPALRPAQSRVMARRLHPDLARAERLEEANRVAV